MTEAVEEIKDVIEKPKKKIATWLIVLGIVLLISICCLVLAVLIAALFFIPKENLPQFMFFLMPLV